eukprot:m.233462 g.233462  ORF g.233462 m.233462 type:complete len:612 (+) comp19158_c0_seq1:183-2018(+)
MKRNEHSNKRLVVLGKDLPSTGAHEAIRGQLARLCELAHAGAADHVKVGGVLGVEESHAPLLLVICSHDKRNDLQPFQPGCHLQHGLSMVGIIQIDVLVGGVGHAGRVTAHNVVVCACVHASLGVPLHLRWPRVQHRAGEDRNESGIRVQHALTQDTVMLSHAHGQRHVVVLGPAAEGVQQQQRLLESALQQHLVCVLHEEGVTVVDGIAQLKGKDSIGTALGELGPKLVGSEAVVVQAVVPGDALQHLQVAAHQPLAVRVDLCNVRVARVAGAKLPARPLLLAGCKELGLLKNGHGLVLVDESHGLLTCEPGLVLICCWQDNGDRLVHNLAIRLHQSSKVQALQKLGLAHEALERRGPSLGQHLQPLERELVDGEGRQSSGLCGLCCHLGRGYEELSNGRDLRLHNVIALQERNDLLHGLLEGFAVQTNDELWLAGSLVHIVDASEALDQPRTRLLVQTLGITRLACRKGSGHIALDEAQASIFVQLAHIVAVGFKGADEGGEGHNAAISKELANFTHTANVLRTIFSREAQILVQPVAHVVAIQTIARHPTSAQFCLNCEAQRCFSSARETCKPHGTSMKARFNTEDLRAAGARDHVFHGRNVCRHFLR